MKAMVLAAGFGTRLRPITYELAKPMVPILDRPVMAHIVGMLERQGFTDLIANLHHRPDTIREYFGDRIAYSFEEELLGIWGGMRRVRDFFGDEPLVIVSGDALTDTDLNELVERHESSGGIATLTVKEVEDSRGYGVLACDSDGRVRGFQEKPDPAEAISQLANCGIYCFSPEIFDHFPDTELVDLANDVVPTLLRDDVPLHVHEIEDYWNDVGSLAALRQGTWDALAGAVKLEVSGRPAGEGVTVGQGTSVEGVEVVEGTVWVGSNVSFGTEVKLIGPIAIGDGCTIGDGAALRETIVLPGSDIAAGQMAIGSIHGGRGIAERLRPFDEL